MQLTTTMTEIRHSVQERMLAKENVRVWVTAVLLLFIFITGFAIVQYTTPALVGNDGYYHMKMGYLIRTEGLTPDFPYLPYTILKEAAYYDHHLLFHVFLALFATTDPVLDGGLALTQGAKLASIVMPSLAFLAVWWLLRGQKVPYAAVWAIALLAVSEAFLYRMSMPRAQSMSLVLLVLALHWLLQGKYNYLLPLGFVFVWAYNAFPLLIAVAGAYVIATFMLERRFAWQAFRPHDGSDLFGGRLFDPQRLGVSDVGHRQELLGAGLAAEREVASMGGSAADTARVKREQNIGPGRRIYGERQ